MTLLFIPRSCGQMQAIPIRAHQKLLPRPETQLRAALLGDYQSALAVHARAIEVIHKIPRLK
jgi:hypothetical protein